MLEESATNSGSHNIDLLGSRDVICGLAIWGFLYVVNLNRLSVSQGFLSRKLCEIKLQWYWSHTGSFVVTWRHRSCDRWIRHMGFPIGGQFEPTDYLARFLRYWASKILGSRPWRYRVTWRHQSRDYWTPDMQFPIGHSVLWNRRSISHRCWDIVGQTLSQAHSRWKCIDPHFCVLGFKIGYYSILQLCASSRSL